MKTKFVSLITEEVRKKIFEAKEKGLLFIDQQKTNLQCDVCGKEDVMNYFIVVVHTKKENMLNDPMSGEVFRFGSSCYKEFRRKTFSTELESMKLGSK